MSVRFKWPPDLAAFRFGSALIWALRDGGISASISGISPLSLVNAIAKPITKLLQHGKVAVSGSTLTCNNGELVAVDDELPIGYKRITSIKFDGDFWYDTNEILTGNDNVTMTLANTSSSGQNVFGSYNKTGTGVKNFSLYVYGGGSSSKSYFRYGEQLLRPQFGSGERTIIFGKDGTSGFLSDVTVTPETFTTVATTYIGMLPNSSSAAYTGSIVGNILVGDRLKYIPCERVSDGVIGYYEMVNEVFLEPVGTGTPVKDDYDTSHCTVVSAQGTPEEIVVSASGVEDQTAHAENLYAVGDIEDTQDIITGTVTRRTEAVVSDGTTPSGRYVGTVGEGNIIIKAREEGYTGDIISFETEEEKPLNGLVVNLSPQQDLHGYDSPWPAGGGKQLLDPSTFDIITTTAGVTATLNSDGTISLSGTATATAYIQIIGYKLLSDYGIFTADTTYKLSGYANSNCYVGFSIKGSGTDYWASTAAGKDMSFTAEQLATKEYRLIILVNNGTNTNGITIKPMICLASASNPTTFAPYENICPISGWTGCEVWRTGKNLLDMRNVQEGNYNKWNIPNLLKPDTVYTFSVRNATHPYGVFLTENHTETGSGSTYQLTNYINNGSITFTTPSNVQDYPWIIIGGGDSQAGHASADLQIELGATATAYEPYNGNSYSVTWEDEAGTVYGGTVDLVSGKLIIDMAFIGLGTLSYTYYPDYNTFVVFLEDKAVGEPPNYGKGMVCSAYPTSEYIWYSGYKPDKSIGGTNGKGIAIKDSRYTDVPTFKAAMSGVQLAYPLETPIELTITPTPITALKGYNAMWSNAGTVTTYVPAGDLIEQVTPQKLNTAEGDNTIIVTAEVEDIVFDVTYRENNPDG